MKNAPRQQGITVVTTVIPEKLKVLRETLNEISTDVEENELIPFLKCKCIHFARWLILEPSLDASGDLTPTTLVFSTNYDGATESHLAELYEYGAAALDKIYGCCRDYPPKSARNLASVSDYLLAHNIGQGALYVGTQGLTVQQIKDDDKLYREISSFLDRLSHNEIKQDERVIQQQIQQFVNEREDLRKILSCPYPLYVSYPHRLYIALILLLLVIALFLAGYKFILFLFSGIILLLLILLFKEKTDVEFPAVTDFDHLEKLLKKEDIFSDNKVIVQNQMSSITNIKLGWFRSILLRAVLAFVKLTSRYIYTKGKLGSISSIHFARWVILDKGKRLLFLSNFDGSWENYLGDFIDKAASGLTAIWSNTAGFPRTHLLTRKGARAEKKFKAYARSSQSPTEVWYSAYKYLTVQNIWNNAKIRASLSRPQTPQEIKKWLRLF